MPITMLNRTAINCRTKLATMRSWVRSSAFRRFASVKGLLRKAKSAGLLALLFIFTLDSVRAADTAATGAAGWARVAGCEEDQLPAPMR